MKTVQAEKGGSVYKPVGKNKYHVKPGNFFNH
jgi:hypothetical protein